MTSSPGLTPKAFRAILIADVPEVTAKQYFYQLQLTSKGPLNAQPLNLTGESELSLKLGNLSNSFGRATSPIRHLEIHAPAQKWGPAPNVMVFDLS